MCCCFGILIWFVINFDFVYDIDSSMMIDSYWDEDGELLEDMNDFVWYE